MLGAVHGTPGLQELALGLPALHELVGGEKGCGAGVLAAREAIGRHAGGHVEEAEVMVIELDAVLDAVLEALDVLEGAVAVLLVPRHLVGEPEKAGPEAVGPLDAVNDRVLEALGSRPGKPRAEGLHVGVNLGEAAGQAAIDLLLGQGLDREPPLAIGNLLRVHVSHAAILSSRFSVCIVDGHITNRFTPSQFYRIFAFF